MNSIGTFNPVIVIAPLEPLEQVAGVTAPDIVGVAFTVKLVALVAVPPEATTLIAPVVPAAGIAVICVDESTVKDKAFVPPNVTAVAPVKFVPVITTGVVLAQPLEGVKLEIVGGVEAITFME